MKEAIGGYFSLELPRYEEYHSEGVRLNNGRNCLEYLLRCRKPSKIYIPYYTCEAVLEPIQRLHIGYQFYHIDLQFEIAEDIELSTTEVLLYTNYFGLKQRYAEQLAQHYGQCLIIDNTQAFFAKPIDGIDTFYTCRKFFGVPDGAYLYTDAQADSELDQDSSYDRMTALLKRIDLGPEAGYADFSKTEEAMSGLPIRRMSMLTKRLMQSINYEQAARQRRNNFEYLHQALGQTNQLTLTLEPDAVPMIYPYFSAADGLRENLIKNKIFVACYWPNVEDWAESGSIEYQLMQNLTPLPVDQRYAEKEMKEIANMIVT